MTTLRILDIEVNVPDGVQLVTDPPEECRIFHTLKGDSAQDVRTTLEREATKRGYNLRRTDRASYLTRGEQRIEVHPITPKRLGIRVDDAEALPSAEISGQGIGLAGIILPVPEGSRVEPGRERHDPGSSSWRAEWRIYECKAAGAAGLMHDALVQLGLRSGGLWQPPTGGIRRWKVEASSSQVLIQVGITEADSYLDVNVTVIGTPEELLQPRKG